MKESYSEGLAIHTGPESCGVAREDNVEALTGESAGRVFSRETSPPGRRRCQSRRKATSDAPLSRGVSEFRAVADPEHAPKHLAREPGDPAFAHGENGLGRIGKSKDVRR